jgi:hypothetical protein
MPASFVTTPPSPSAPPHTSPATRHPVVPGALGDLHTPTVAPWALLQMPAQHSVSVAHTSPVCVQNDPLVHLPLVQSFEQHSVLVVHALPEVRQAPFRGTQTFEPPSTMPHVPLQHSDDVVQAWLSVVHWEAPQVPLLQTNVQQSCGIAQVLPAALHALTGFAHAFVC